eukprot:354182-Chlamydomonas_euryale.AAC.2
MMRLLAAAAVTAACVRGGDAHSRENVGALETDFTGTTHAAERTRMAESKCAATTPCPASSQPLQKQPSSTPSCVRSSIEQHGQQLAQHDQHPCTEAAACATCTTAAPGGVSVGSVGSLSAEPFEATWISLFHPAHTPPRLLPGAEKKGKGRKRPQTLERGDRKWETSKADTEREEGEGKRLLMFTHVTMGFPKQSPRANTDMQ